MKHTLTLLTAPLLAPLGAMHAADIPLAILPSPATSLPRSTTSKAA